jgi:hypothetical protein
MTHRRPLKRFRRLDGCDPHFDLPNLETVL